MFNLKNFLEEAWAQAVPGDNKTAATVRASRQQAQPAVTTRKQPPRANIKPFKNPQIERAARNLRAGKMTPDAFANYVTSMGPSKDWRDNTSTGNKFVDGSINVAKGIGNTGTQVAKGLVNPDTYVGGVKRFDQAIASTILKPVSDRYADQERERAERLLIPSYENMYRAYGADPRLGKNQAQIEANMADYNLRTDPLRRNNINVNDSTGTVTRKVGAKGAEAFLDIVTAPMGGAALKAGAKGMVRPVLANTFKAGLTGSGNALAYAAQQDGMSGTDYIKAGSQGFAMGSAMPLVMGAAGKTLKDAVGSLPQNSGKAYPYTNYKINETPSGKLKLSKDLPQTIETAKTALLNGKEAIKRFNAGLGEGGYVQVGPTPKKIHPDDMNVMAEYIDMARGVKGPATEARLIDLEYEADAIARRYGLTRPGETPSPAQLANKFDNRLMTEHYGKTQPEVQSKPKKKSIWNDQGGYVKNPFYKDNPVTEGLSKEQQVGKPSKVTPLEAEAIKHGSSKELAKSLYDRVQSFDKTLKLTKAQKDDLHQYVQFKMHDRANKPPQWVSDAFDGAQTKNKLRIDAQAAPTKKTPQVGKPDPTAALKQEADMWRTQATMSDTAEGAAYAEAKLAEVEAKIKARPQPAPKVEAPQPTLAINPESGLPQHLHDKLKSKGMLDSQRQGYTVEDVTPDGMGVKYNSAEDVYNNRAEIEANKKVISMLPDETIEQAKRRLVEKQINNGVATLSYDDKTGWYTGTVETSQGIRKFQGERDNVIDQMFERYYPSNNTKFERNITSEAKAPQPTVAPKGAPIEKTPTQMGRGLHTNTEAEARANLQALVDAEAGNSVLADAARSELQRYTDGIPPIAKSGAPTQNTPTLQDALDGKSTKVKELPNKPSGRMSKAEKESLYASAPPGTERTLKVQQPNNGSNVPVSKVTQQGDVVTKTNVNPNIKKGEKRFSLDDKGDLIPDQNGAYRLFTDDDGKVTGFRVGDKYYSAKDFGDLSDVNDYGSALATQRRNVERAFGKETGEKVNQFLVDHQQAQATKMIERQLEFSKGLDSLKKELGISFKIGRHRAKKVSAAIQDYGEGKIRKPELIEQFGKDQADKIVKADKWFRNQYDTLLDEMNDTLVKYGYDPVPKRKNYYTHFQEPSLWQSFGLKMQELKNMSSPTMQDALPDAPRGSISNKLAGQSEYLQPNKKFNQFALQRKGDLHKADAFGAFERYLNPTLNNIYMTPSITRARVISRAIAQEADLAGKDANGILIQTREWANSLAGKSNRWGDRQLSDSKFGRKYLKATQWAQKMAGQNTIVGNLSTAVMQPIVLQQTVGKFGIKNTILGLMQEMGTAHSKNAPIRKSPFMNRRYSKFESATAGKIDAARGIANKPLEVVEKTAARVTWNAAHNDALSQGLTGSKAIRYADINAEKTLAGRAIGEKPEMFRSKTAAPLTMYQLEVNNFWQQFGKEMTKTQAAKTMAAAYGLNLVLQEITGRQVGFNPVDAAIDSYQETQKEDKTTGQKAITIAQRAAGEVVDNTPFVGPVMNMIVGDKGVKGMTGNDSNTGKFGVGSPLSALTNTTKVEVGGKEIPVPLNAILPFGGAQVKKTYEGWKALQDGGLDDKNDKRLVDIPQSAENTAKGLVFGKGAIPEVNQYYENIGKKKADQKPVQNQTSSRASKMGPAGSGDDPKDIYNAAFGTKEGQAMLALGTDKEREEQYPELFKDYKAMKTAFEYDRTEERPDNYDKLGNDSKAIFDKLGSMTDEGKKKWLKKTASGSAEKVYNSLNAIKPKDYPDLPKTNEVAKMYADFESDQKENNWTGTRLESEKKKLVRSAYETILDDNEKYILSANTTDTLAMVENGEVDKDTMDKLVQYDDMMIALGGSARISKTVRGKLGYSAATTKSYSSGSRSGSSTKIAKGEYGLADLLSSVQSTNKTLRQLLEQTLKG